MHADETASNGISEGSSGMNNVRELSFDLNKPREHMAIESPIREGLVADWDLLEKLWEHSIVKYCGKDNYCLKDSPVLLAEKPYTPIASRHRYWIVQRIKA